jgi:hypothetical protein
MWNGGSALLWTITVNWPLDHWPKQEQRHDALIQLERSRPTARDNTAMCEIETEREIEGRIISARRPLGPLWLLIVRGSHTDKAGASFLKPGAINRPPGAHISGNDPDKLSHGSQPDRQRLSRAMKAHQELWIDSA